MAISEIVNAEDPFKIKSYAEAIMQQFDTLQAELAGVRRELTKWQEPFDAERFEDTKKQASHSNSLAAQGVYITALEHAMKHLNQQLADANERLDKCNYEDAHTNQSTRSTLFEGIKERDIKIQALEKQLAAREEHLEAQRAETYKAVEREHAAKKRVKELEEALEHIVSWFQNGEVGGTFKGCISIAEKALAKGDV